jgi:hypothetical protein
MWGIPESIAVRMMRLRKIPAQVEIQGNRDAHYHQRTNAQNQKPPDHPHSRLG